MITDIISEELCIRCNKEMDYEIDGHLFCDPCLDDYGKAGFFHNRHYFSHVHFAGYENWLWDEFRSRLEPK